MFTKTLIHNHCIRVGPTYILLTTGLSNVLKIGVEDQSIITASGRISRCSFHAEAERDRPSSTLLKSAVGRSVICETDTQVDPPQTAAT